MTIEEGIEFFEDIARLEYDLVNSYHTDEGVYGREESYHREKAEHHEQVAIWLKELQAHREAWKTVLDDMMNVSIPGQDAEYVYENIYDIINKYRPKEGDAN